MNNFNSQIFLSSLKALSFFEIEIDEEVSVQICKFIKQNRVEEILINSCKIGFHNEVVNNLANAFGQNYSLKGIELNNNNLSDD